MNPPSLPQSRWALQPMEGPVTLSSCIESLLKQPGRILHACAEGSIKAQALLLVITLFCLGSFGLLLGSFSGGVQWWAAPAKVTVGVALSAAICMPSLYIFLALSGAEVRLSQVVTLLLAALGLTGLLLVGFAPVLWVFSQSTESLGFMGFLAILFWVISVLFGMGLLSRVTQAISPAASTGYLLTWIVIFFIVTLQMSTALRPILGTADKLLPEEKRFFLEHWVDEIDGNSRTKASKSGRTEQTKSWE
jgi:hypothetical protein